ncbi:MAG: DUF4956 domain-containing protein [Ilumatobacteraceae bacterium]
MSLAQLFLLDAVAIVLLVFAIYFPRHRRRDMIVALLGINVGVLSVTQALSSTTVSAGLGLGLFGVLSIIRLRSAEMDQGEVAYYFAALALGLLGGFAVDPSWMTPALMAALLAAVFVGDHPILFNRYRHQEIRLDRAYLDEREVVDRLEELLGGTVRRLTIRDVDMVNETTRVDVRFQVGTRSPHTAGGKSTGTLEQLP